MAGDEDSFTSHLASVLCITPAHFYMPTRGKPSDVRLVKREQQGAKKQKAAQVKAAHQCRNAVKQQMVRPDHRTRNHQNTRR
jgi:hypothetical protein